MAPKNDIEQIKAELEGQGKAIYQIHRALLGDLENHEDCPGVLTQIETCKQDRQMIWRVVKGIGLVLVIITIYLVTGELVLP